MMFETAMLLELLEALRNKCYANSRNKGFWDGPENDNIPTKIALLHSELSEMLEAFRAGDPVCPKMIVIEGGSPSLRPITTMEEEAADVFIRLLDLCGRLNIDLGRVTLAKMKYNSNRPHMHGGKKV